MYVCFCVGSQVRSQRPQGVTLPEDVARWEAANTMMLASTHEDVEDLVRKVTLLEGELVEAR
jgi:hypothetical protein